MDDDKRRRLYDDRRKRMLGGQVGAADSLRKVREALNSLPKEYRDVLALKYVENRSDEDISRMLGILPSEIQARVARGKELLRDAIGDSGDK